MKPKSFGFFKDMEWWKEYWQGMPEFIQEDLTPLKTVLVQFKSKEDVKAFSKLVDQTIGKETKYIWYPKNKIDHVTDLAYVDESCISCIYNF